LQLILLDKNPESRALLTGRISEALHQAEIPSIPVSEIDPTQIESFDWSNVHGCLIGPGCFDDLDSTVERVRLVFPANQIAVVLDNQLYAAEAVVVRKKLNVSVIGMGDIAQIASFLLDSDSKAKSRRRSLGGRAVVGVCQFKGGVGVTSLTAALASCWAQHGLKVAAIDFDDVNPHLTAWARVPIVQRSVTAEFLKMGQVPQSRLQELVAPVEGFGDRFVVVGQPEAYNEGFHFKANVLDNAPSSSEFVQNLILALAAEYDAIVIDLGRSWGVASFAALPLCKHVVLVTDDDGMSVSRSLDSLDRLRKESDDPQEFNLDRWSLVLNAFTGKLTTPTDIASEIREMDLFPAHASLFTIPFSEMGRQWGAPGQSLYESADDATRLAIRRMACNLVPFSFEPELGFGPKLINKFRSFIGQ